jgi:LemA protein
MKRWMWILLFIVGFFLLVGFWTASTIIGTYNNLVTLEEDVSAKWSQVENQYQRRADLIPNLVQTVKAYADKEEAIFTQIADARARIGSAKSPVQREQAEGEMSGFLSRLLMITENYPQLKSNQNFLSLQAQLEGTENRISTERQRYIQATKLYNLAVKKFPGRLIAGFLGYEAREFYEASPGAQTVPKVDFGNTDAAKK